MTDQDYNQNALLTIQTTLSQYPILTEKIENEMYNRLIRDGYISITSFTQQIRNISLLTQKREGLQNPFVQEAQSIWEKRQERVRSTLIRQEFAQRYPMDVFEDIVENIVHHHPSTGKAPDMMWHNLLHATVETIIEQALAIEHLPSQERKQFEPQLTAAKVTLIRRLLSTRVPYISVAKTVFSTHDLLEINRRKIGRGVIGSKAAEMLLSNRILHNSEDEDIRSAVGNIESIFIGADEFYNFVMSNNLMKWYDQKYKEDADLWKDYPQLQEDFSKGEFSDEVINGLRNVLNTFDGEPFIVRSSSLLEDSFTHPFNSMYRSIPLANQGSQEENLEALLDAIRTIYASAFNPNALTYRRKNGLVDYDEQMGILIQRVPGDNYGPYHFPDISGIGASKSPFRWSPESIKDEGFLRFTLGMGAHATERNGDDFAHIIELTDPNKRHTTFTADESTLTQKSMMVINLKTNQPELLDVQDVLSGKYPALHLMAQKKVGDRFSSMQRGEDTETYYVTCKDLIERTNFTRLMRDILHTLERKYEKPVLVQFTASIDTSDSMDPQFKIQIHNCRPYLLPDKIKQPLPPSMDNDRRKLFTTNLFVGNGVIRDISYVVYIDPKYYNKIYGKNKLEFCDLLDDINQKLRNETFIVVGASRFGTTENHGIPTEYRDLSNAKAIVELSGTTDQYLSDPFCGTRFFQALMESGIYPIITNADNLEEVDLSFFTDSKDLADDWVGIPPKFRNCVRILPTKGWYGSRSLTIEMNPFEGITKAFFI